MIKEDYESEYGYDDEILSLIRQHREVARDNMTNLASFFKDANEVDFVYSEYLMESYFEETLLHVNSAKYLQRFIKLLDAIYDGYGAFIKCPVCESHKVDLQIGSKVIRQSCVDCDYEWDFPIL